MSGVPRSERVAQVRALRAAGFSNREAAAVLGVSRSTVRNVLHDPDGAKQKERRKRYQGSCVDCGASTDGSNGRTAAPERCARCSWDRQSETRKIWTRERVIDAIQRFASANGRPPLSSEWVASDPVNGYPPRSAVYRSKGSSRTNPFGSWGEAIEAAGFPRPRTGKYERTPATRALTAASQRARWARKRPGGSVAKGGTA